MAYMIPPMYNTEKPVGARDPNQPDDVKLVRALLSEVGKTGTWAPTHSLEVHGRWDSVLGQWILAFQRRLPALVNDSRIHPMPIKAMLDISSRFRSGVGSTLYALNVNHHDKAPNVHKNLGDRLGIRPRQI